MSYTLQEIREDVRNLQNPPMAMMEMAGQVISHTSYTNMVWDDTEFNVGCTTDSSGVTIITPGIYLITTWNWWDAVTTAQRVILGVLSTPGGSLGESESYPSTDNAQHDQSLTVVRNCSVDDTINTRVWQRNSGSASRTITQARLFVAYMGPTP